MPRLSTPSPGRVRLSEHTTLRVGGPARAFVQVDSVEALARALERAEADHQPVLVLGGGSNVVVCDEGFPGTVVRIALRGARLSTEGGGEVLLSAAAGEPWSELVERCVAEGLSGIECLAGIPGLVGATPVQNVGAYGQEVSDTIWKLTVWDRSRRCLRELSPGEVGFAYRDSLLKRSSRFVVTEVTFQLERSRLSRPVRYGELARHLGARVGSRAPLAEVAGAVLELRRAKGMVLDPAGPVVGTAGSFFTNPVLEEGHWERLQEVAPGVPGFPTGKGVKVPAAWLVERAGFARGYRMGGAAISSRHALALTVLEGGTAADLLALARAVRDGVRARFGITLEPEPVLVGLDL